jgi:hypothetical protein
MKFASEMKVDMRKMSGAISAISVSMVPPVLAELATSQPSY